MALFVRALVLAFNLFTRMTMNQTVQTPSSDATAARSPRSGNGASPRPPRVAVISASWHQEIVHRARDSLVEELGHLGVPRASVDLFDVPGAFEIPLHAKCLARTGRYDAIVACGLVVNGGIYRHEFVAGAVIDGLMRVQLDTDVPVLSAVPTPGDFHEHEEHNAFFGAQFVEKGVEAALAWVGAVT